MFHETDTKISSVEEKELMRMLSELHCAERDSEKSVGTFGISKQMGSMSIASMSFFRDDDVSENVERG